jgi:hypothetical protein
MSPENHQGTPAFVFTRESHAPEEVASVCRDVALEFMNRVARDFDPRAFVAWAIRDYRRATVAGADGARPRTLAGVALAPRALCGVICAAHEAVAAELERAGMAGRTPRFVAAAVRHGLVALAYNDLAQRCWVAIDVAHAPLGERLLALFAVDCLTTPHLYAEELCVCPLCSAVVFDPAARESGRCVAHVSDRRSGTVLTTHRHGTMRGLG